MPVLQVTSLVPGCAHGALRMGLGQTEPGCILVLRQDELAAALASWKTPSAPPGRPAALVVVEAAPLSHIMIRAMGLGLPIVALASDQLPALIAGSPAVVDADRGRLHAGLEEPAPCPAPGPALPQAGAVVTADGQAVRLRASVADVAGVERARSVGAEAVGLVRSELLLSATDREPPDADRFERALAALCEPAGDLAMTVRLLDLATNKVPQWARGMPGLGGPLGLQGPRLYGLEPVRSAFYALLDALGRLSMVRPVSVLIPYVTRPEEFERWRREVESRLPAPIAVGCMIETPAAAFCMRDWLEQADFVAVGCNDLMQCLFAADRDLGPLAHLLDPYTPVLFRFLRQLADEAGDERGQIQVCGLLPQLPGILPVLLGLGFRTFCVEPGLIPFLARRVQQTDTERAEGQAVGLCGLSSAEAVRAVLDVGAGAPWGVAPQSTGCG